MHYTGPVFRPPPEANTPLLEVTYGCSWNKCSFCSMYLSIDFGISPIEDIEEDLQEMSRYYPKDLKRIFLVNGDAFALPTRKLVEIGELIHKYFPQIECLTCYASIRNIKSKTLKDLEKLHSLGFNELYLGLETAYGPALTLMKKGYTNEDEYRQLSKLKDAGIEYNAIIMLGVAGRNNFKENVIETADLINHYPPKMFLTISTAVQPGTPLFEMVSDGEFVEATEREMLEEQIMFLENLDLSSDTMYFAGHPYNIATINGYFGDKGEMILKIKEIIAQLDETRPGLLDGVLKRGGL